MPTRRATSAKRNLPSHLLPDLGLLVITILVLLRVYATVDPDEMRVGSIFPWDSGVYRLVADGLSDWSPSNPIIAAYPWGPRLLFPAFYGVIAHITGIADFQAAYLVEVGAVILFSIITFTFWRRSQISRPLAWVGMVLFLLAWGGPLRNAGLFPGGGFASQLLTVWMVFAALVLARKGGIWRLVGACGLMFLAAISREFSTYILVLVLALSLLVKLAEHKHINFARLPLLKLAMKRLRDRPLLGIILLLASSIAGYAVAHWVVQDPASTYSVTRTAISYGYFHLNIMETLYPYFYGLGPFALVLALALTFAKSRRALADRLARHLQNLDLVLIFIAIGVLFSLFGGTDSDRFLVWMFPFFGVLALESSAVLLTIGGRRITATLIALLAIGLLWTRFYVPAIPHLFFPGDNYCAQGGVRTDYDPSLYTGPPLMANLRQPLITVPVDPEHLQASGTYASDASAQIPGGCQPEWTSALPDAYRGDVNLVPFPLGFAHNQYELLVAHPYHGNWQVRAMLFAQWAVIYLALVALLWAPLRSRKLDSATANQTVGPANGSGSP